MRRTLIALLVVFVLAACGGDESKPADTDGQTPTGKGGGDIVTLKPPPPGQATPEKTPPPPEDPTIALEKLANSAFESDDMELALEAIDKILNGSGDKGKRARLLARALEYDDPDVRSTAVVAIGKMEVPTVAPNIRSLLSREKDALVRKEAVVSLFALVNKEAVIDLVAILEN